MATPRTVTPTHQTITRDDLEQKLRAFQDGIRGKVDDKRNTIVGTVGAIALVLLLLTYVLGRRSGRKRTTLVEIRRV